MKDQEMAKKELSQLRPLDKMVDRLFTDKTDF